MIDKQIIDDLLKERKITAKELFITIGMTQTGYRQMFERGTMKVSTLQKIAAFFNLPITYFFNQTNTENKAAGDADYKEKYLECVEEQLRLLKENADLKSKSPHISLSLNQPELKYKTKQKTEK